MNSNDTEEIKNTLSQWLKYLSAISSETTSMFSKTIGNFADPVDRASAQSEMDYAFNRRRRDELNIENIRNALGKLDKGSYGICEGCEEEIPIKRLKAIPDARYCLSCQLDLEKDGNYLAA
jgi:DnaK suppressor protein